MSEKAKEIEEKLPVLKHQQARWKNNPQSFSVNRFLAINIKKKEVFVLEFKQSTDRVQGFLETKEAAANEKHSSIIEVLRAVADGWVVMQISFVAGNRGLVMESDFYEKLENFDVQAGEKDKIFSDHLTQVCEAHDRVTLSYHHQIQGSPGVNARGSKDDIVQNVYA